MKKQITISGAGVAIMVLIAVCVTLWLTRPDTKPLRAEKVALEQQVVVKTKQIDSLQSDIMRLKRLYSTSLYQDSLKGEKLKKVALESQIMASKISTLTPGNTPKDSAVGFLVGEYGVPIDTLMLWGGDVLWKISTDAKNVDVYEQLVQLLDSQIVIMHGREADQLLMRKTLEAQVVSCDSVVSLQSEIMKINAEAIVDQHQKIKRLKTHRLVLCGGIVVLFLIAL